ncbi:hypothetical protein LguiB_021727 [Lonicera macranthoides]
MRAKTFGFLYITAQPPPSAAVAPPPLPATAALPAAASRAAVVPILKTGVKVITLAGDNEGATVKLSSSRNKGYSVEISDEEGNSNQNPGVGFEINSSVQGVNNSILYNSSLTHQSPGVHLTVYSKANGACHQ